MSVKSVPQVHFDGGFETSVLTQRSEKLYSHKAGVSIALT